MWHVDDFLDSGEQILGCGSCLVYHLGRAVVVCETQVVDKLLVACNVAVVACLALYHPPFVLYEVGCECGILLAIVDEWVAVAHHLAIGIAPVVEVVAGVWCRCNLYSFLVGDAQLVCAFDGNSAVGTCNSCHGAILGYLLHNGQIECDACAIAECDSGGCLANLGISGYGNRVAAGCELLALRCCTVGIDINPHCCDVDILAYCERQLHILSAINLGHYVTLCGVALHTHREQVVLTGTLYASKVFAECLYRLLGCAHVGRYGYGRVVIVGVVHCPWIFNAVVPTARWRAAVVLKEMFPTSVVEVLD